MIEKTLKKAALARLAFLTFHKHAKHYSALTKRKIDLPQGAAHQKEVKVAKGALYIETPSVIGKEYPHSGHKHRVARWRTRVPFAQHTKRLVAQGDFLGLIVVFGRVNFESAAQRRSCFHSYPYEVQSCGAKLLFPKRFLSWLSCIPTSQRVLVIP